VLLSMLPFPGGPTRDQQGRSTAGRHRDPLPAGIRGAPWPWKRVFTRLLRLAGSRRQAFCACQPKHDK